MWDQNSLGLLEDAVDTFDIATAEGLCEGLIRFLAVEGPISREQADAVLRVLRRKRHFALMRRIAKALLDAGHGSPGVRRQYGQALIENGEFAAAIQVLEGVIAELEGTDREDAEVAEARGLIGRAHKQKYVSTLDGSARDRGETLNAAVNAYLMVYGRNPAAYTWHGINVVSLARRAARDGVALAASVDTEAIASAILKVIRARPVDGLPAFDLATAAEASWALGRRDDAFQWYRRYVARGAGADAFEIASTLRQLREVWQLVEGSDGGELISVLQAALLQREGAAIPVAAFERTGFDAPAPATVQAFEKVFGDEATTTLQGYLRPQVCALAVGRVEDPLRKGIGSGFLLRASDVLGPGRGSAEDQIFVTNSHVVSRKDVDALPPAHASVCFEVLDAAITFKVVELLWESPRAALDVALLRLDRQVNVAPLDLSQPEPLPSFVAGTRRRLYAIGYPHGGRLALSINDNLQVGWARPRLHYRTATEPGSSGCPIFDRYWQVVAVHHMGRFNMPRVDGQPGVYEANEGLWIHDIIEMARKELAP
jgi:Trypsin-like peptidase domain